MSRGQPKRPKLNVRTKPEEISAMLAEFAPDDPFRDVMPDGRGIDFMVPLPPWNAATTEQIRDNLAILRVDPNHSNYAQMEIGVVRAIAKIESEELNYEIHTHQMGVLFDKLLAETSADAVEQVFSDILRMKKKSEESPHPVYHTYKAYLDFMEEFGFQPTKQRLAKFISSNFTKYPVGKKPANVNATEWWDMLFDAGLSRLNE